MLVDCSLFVFLPAFCSAVWAKVHKSVIETFATIGTVWNFSLKLTVFQEINRFIFPKMPAVIICLAPDFPLFPNYVCVSHFLSFFVSISSPSLLKSSSNVLSPSGSLRKHSMQIRLHPAVDFHGQFINAVKRFSNVLFIYCPPAFLSNTDTCHHNRPRIPASSSRHCQRRNRHTPMRLDVPIGILPPFLAFYQLRFSFSSPSSIYAPQNIQRGYSTHSSTLRWQTEHLVTPHSG